MQRWLLLPLLGLLLAFGMPGKASGQSTLATGEIIFTSFQANAPTGTPDTFSFVLLVPISSNTTIYFTDRGYNGSGYQGVGTTEGTIGWTSGTALPVGTEVMIHGLGSNAARVNGNANGNVVQIAGGHATAGLSIGNGGDQLLAFQGGAGDPTSGGVTRIAGIHFANCANGGTTDASWDAVSCTGPTSSAIYPDLTGGTSAFWTGAFQTQGKFNGAGTPFSTVASLRAALMNRSNWVFSNDQNANLIDVPGGYVYYATCAAPSISAQPPNRTICNGGTTTMGVTASGTSLSYQWQVNTGSGFNPISNGGNYNNATTATLSILNATSAMNGYSYRCVVTGACGTATSTNATLTVTTITLTPSQTNVACNGASTGSATVVASGGATPYTYSWSPSGGTAASATGLNAGSYTVTVTDNNTCQATQSFTITQPPAFSITSSQTNVACNGAATGSATVNVSGGTGTYSYSWSPSGGTAATATGLSAGSYVVTITDANLCQATRNFTITQPPAFSSTTSQTNVACNGASTGSATVNVSGATGPYSYSWSPSGGTAATATGLSAGSYVVTITDANLCQATRNFTITQPPAFSVTTSQTNVACNGASTGSATVNVSGATGPYSYSWSPSGGTAATATGLSAGSYVVTITDANLCQATRNFTITQPPAFSVTTSQTNVACNGASTGSATVNVSGATGPYTYSWSPSGGTAATATGLSAGSYTVTIKDANLCQATRNFTITQPPAFSVTTSQTNVACNGASTGSATVNVSGATGPYTYSWSPSGGTAATATGLSAGSYTVTITDANLCQATRNFTITQPPAFSSTTSQTNVACNGASTGSATVNVSGATGPYSYSWSPSGGTAATATGLSAGSYVVTITDANLCQTTRNFTITQPPAFSVTTSQTNVACNGASTGSATVNVSGATGPYSYSWSPSGGTAATATGLSAGSYTVTIKDANLCQTTRNFTITQPPAFSVTTSQTNIACNGASTGSATVNVSGATGPYSYSWSPSGGTAATATGLSAGNYTVTITDGNFCQTTRNFTITQPPAFSVTTSQTNVACNGASTGSATVNVSGATGPYSYSWSPSGGTAATATGLSAGSYVVTITDANLCQATRNFTITQPPAFSVTTSQTNVACNGASTGSATVNVSGATGPYTYSWSPSGGTAATATGLVAGSYTVTIKDANLCQTTRNFTITQPATSVAVTASADTSICAGSSAFISASATGGTGAITYTWTPGSLSGASQVVTPDTTTRFIVTATDNAGCFRRDTVIVNVGANLALAGVTNSNSNAGTITSNNTETESGVQSYYSGNCALVASVDPDAALGTVTAKVTVEASVPVFQGRPYVARWYEITPQNNGAADVTLYFTQADFNQYNTYASANNFPLLPQGPSDLAGIDTLVITKMSGGNLNTGQASLIRPDSVVWNSDMSYWAVSFRVTSFSQFYVHANNVSGTPLPVEYGSFTARRDQGKALLDWTTLQERNNDRFIIERSTDGKQYHAIGTVSSKATEGNSSAALNYSFTDSKPASGNNFYRLAQVDKDGKQTRSAVRMLDFSSAVSFRLYPNPADEQVMLEHSADQDGKLKVLVMDVLSKVVYEQHVIVNKGLNSYRIGLSGLPQGMYSLNVLDERGVIYQTKIIKK